MRRVQLPDGAPAGLEVWALPLDLDAPLASEDWAILSPKEQVRAMRFHRHADRVRAVRGRASLRRLLESKVGVSARLLQFSDNEFGKPSLVMPGDAVFSPIEFNLSHAGAYVLLAMCADAAVGVDVEGREREADAAALGDYFLSSLERAAGAGIEAMHRWVAKESVLKALGLGIADHLQTYSVVPCGAKDRVAVYRDLDRRTDIHTWVFDVDAKHVGAVTCIDPPARPAFPGACASTSKLQFAR